MLVLKAPTYFLKLGTLYSYRSIRIQHPFGPFRRPLSRRSAFTLVELLAVIAILLILLSLLLPLISVGKDRARMTHCAANLRQVYALCIGFSSNHNSMLPQGLGENPQQLSNRAGYTNFKYLNEFMQINGFPPSIWYCPALPGIENVIKNAWNNPSFAQSHYTTSTSGEFPIGYAYAGNPTTTSLYKYTEKPPVTKHDLMDSNALLIWDYCKAARPSPLRGDEVTHWILFPHFGVNRPGFSLQMRGAGHVEQKRTADLRQRYN